MTVVVPVLASSLRPEVMFLANKVLVAQCKVIQVPQVYGIHNQLGSRYRTNSVRRNVSSFVFSCRS